MMPANRRAGSEDQRAIIVASHAKIKGKMTSLDRKHALYVTTG